MLNFNALAEFEQIEIRVCKIWDLLILSYTHTSGNGVFLELLLEVLMNFC